ncbi:hypothetical protein TNCV_810871 [Trichonephila clavipes]|uniref:Uncharacterized protein n=1 Tax=Trichonephila clavipes TaxID=2585209 RepID=A0A8X6S875_TRICX|nr:hypothetical protein TNCV_810871 [Trichonephila clavipes]
MPLKRQRSHYQQLNEIEGGLSGSDKTLPQESYGPITLGFTTDRKDQRIYYMFGNHRSASTAEIAVFLDTQVPQ